MINQVLTKTVKQNLRNWDVLIPSVTFAYNTSKHSSTTFTPYYLVYLRQPRLALDLLLERKDRAYQDHGEYTEAMKENLRKAYNIVQSKLKGTIERMKKRYDKRIRQVQFKTGEFVYYYSPRAPPGRGRKFRMYTSGPFRVMKRINKVNYRI